MSIPTPKPRRPNRWGQTRTQAKRKLKIGLLMGLIAALSFSLALYLQNKGIEHPIISPLCRILFGVCTIGCWWGIFRGGSALYINLSVFREGAEISVARYEEGSLFRKSGDIWLDITEIIDEQ